LSLSKSKIDLDIKNWQQFCQKFKGCYFDVNENPNGTSTFLCYGSFLREDWLKRVEDFELLKTGCFFNFNGNSFTLNLKEIPQDKWGNKLIPGEIVEVDYKDGYEEVYHHAEYISDFQYPYDCISNYIDENCLEQDYRNWFLEKYVNYDFLSSISVTEKVDGETLWHTTFVTTNIQSNSPEWQKVREDFKNDWENGWEVI
jgi:hypothetical protein